MRYTSEHTIGEALTEFLRHYGLSETYLKVKVEMQAKEIWEDMVGKIITKYTPKITFRKGTFFIHTTSPTVKMELEMLKSQLLEKFTEQVGNNIIKKIEIK
jgi:predicted nucleic acid-binding Zn ribbon protein